MQHLTININSMKTFNKFLFFIVFISVILTACSGNKEETSETTQTTASDIGGTTTDEVSLTGDQYKVAEVELGRVELRNLSNVIKVNGMIDVEPKNVAVVSAPLGGFVKSAGLLPGEVVRKGQVMAIIENPEFIDIQQDYLESKGRMTYLQQELKRQRELQKEEINSLKTLQQISSEYNIMVAKLAGLKQKLALIGINANRVSAGNISRTANLYAPISGYVTESNVSRGKYVLPSDVLFELTNKSDMHLELNVFEKDASKINQGQSIRFALANETDYNRVAKVFLVGQEAGKDGTISVHCHIEVSNSRDMLPGMYVKAMIATKSADVPALPVAAIVQSEGKDYIFIQTDTANKKITFKMVPVVKILEQDEYVEVALSKNLNTNTGRIVIKGAYSLLAAMKNVEE